MRRLKMENLPKLDLNVTNRCNFRCIHCAFDSGEKCMEDLPLSVIEKILIQTKELGGKRFDITGGEPLLREDVRDIIRIGKSLDYKIELVTNGSLITEEKLKKFKQLGLDAIAISLDGSNSEVYNSIRKQNEKTFYRVLKNIDLIKNYGFYTKINTTVFENNFSDITNIVNLAERLKVDELGLYYFTPVGRGERTEAKSVEPIKWLSFVRKLKQESHNLKISFEIPLIEKEYYSQNLDCIANTEKSHLQILPNGETYPCAIMAFYQKSLGNLREKSISEVWNENNCSAYWNTIRDIFESCSGSCVNFSSFNITDYSKDYNFICPLRKFKLAGFK